jgi:hypothetical protein
MRAMLPRGEDSRIGWNPRAYKKTMYALAMRAGAELKTRDPQRWAHVYAEDFARALGTHKLRSGHLSQP